ncbi:hypothetical protein [Evansella cellulosilytica]|uniref:Uncharacterized protein n=1 Tax=Evansella cellulosilytica (strain ATCC 21833 / DSM 2522 / FERM P-1141 / JCM 9156 / N-4) TaxID=649639 RepID=E6TRX3_EVAC2|nr:hypothetical protein [Evansella cellulosilytica]ADU29496.1 hypothetical protein Bcell_1231 [Evansella cellulosilytica DSM 2522]
MNKYIQNMIAIVFIVVSFLLFFEYRVGIDFGLWHLFLVIVAGYGIYLNLTALKKVRS